MVIDTNILIACLNGDSSVVTPLSQWRKEGRALFVSSVSVAETLSLPNLSADQISVIKAFLINFVSIPFDDTSAECAAMLRRMYRLELPDAAIAAAAYMRHVPLVTRDRIFKRVKDLPIMEI